MRNSLPLSLLSFFVLAFAAIVLGQQAAQAATANLFQVAEQSHMANGHTVELAAAKCGAGACGGKTADKDKAHSCGAKDKEHTCGGKDKAHSCGGKTKEAGHKCGAKDKEHTCGAAAPVKK